MKLSTLVFFRSTVFILLFVFVFLIIYANKTYNTNFSYNDEYEFVVVETQYHIKGYKSDATSSVNDCMTNIIILITLLYVHWTLCIVNDRINYIFTKNKCMQNNSLVIWDTQMEYDDRTNQTWCIFLIIFAIVIWIYDWPIVFEIALLDSVNKAADIFNVQCTQNNYIPTIINNVTFIGKNYTNSDVPYFKCIEVMEVIEGSFIFYNNIMQKISYMLGISLTLFIFTPFIMIIFDMPKYKCICSSCKTLYNNDINVNESKQITLIEMKNENKEINTEQSLIIHNNNEISILTEPSITVDNNN